MSGDIAIIWTDDNVGDIGLLSADLATDDGLETAVLISLFSDQRAAFGESLPVGEPDRRGWWGDINPQVDGDVIGSKLWLLFREKKLSSVVDRAREYAESALQWLIDDKVAKSVTVIASAEKVGQQDALIISVSIARPNGDSSQFKYGYAWQNQAAKVLG